MNHVICILLFGKQESQELILESWNQAKIPKDSESRQQKFTVVDPSPKRHQGQFTFKHETLKILYQQGLNCLLNAFYTLWPRIRTTTYPI